jgi:hypothetical protein
MNSGSTRKTTGIIMAISFTPPALEPPAAGLPDIRVLGAENLGQGHAALDRDQKGRR